MIAVTYDVQTLGLAMQFDSARTGINRVADNVARGIAADPACEVRFCNAGSWTLNPFCTRYLRQEMGFTGATIIPPTAFTPAHRLGAACRVEARQKAKYRFVCAAAIPVNTALAAWHAGRTAAAARRADVYHSPFHALPETVGTKGGGTAGRPARFLTVYDLIPVLHPEWFDGPGGNTIVPMFHRTMRSLRPSDHVHCISESTRNDLLNYLPHLDPSRVFVASLAAEPTVFHAVFDAQAKQTARDRYGIADGPYLLSVCTLEPRKNIDAVVRAFGRVAAERGMADLQLVLVGARGWNTARIDQAVQAAGGARGRVIVTGFVPDGDLAPLYGGATAFVYPSLYEGFGLPPLEAMACGVPVLTSNTSSLPEVVRDAGLMVDPADVDGLAQAMLTLVRDDGLRRELARRAVARAATFSWPRCVGRVVAEYSRAVAGAGRA